MWHQCSPPDTIKIAAKNEVKRSSDQHREQGYEANNSERNYGSNKIKEVETFTFRWMYNRS